MSYIQGTTVRLFADFTHSQTGAPVTPDDVVLIVDPPGDLEAFQKTSGAAEVLPDPDRAGRYYYLLDTSPAAGTWLYQFEDATEGARTIQRRELTVTARLDVPDP